MLKFSTRQRSVATSKKKAEAVAGVLGEQVDKAVSVTEVTPTSYSERPVLAYAASAAASSPSPGAGQAAGELVFTATVTATFALK